LFTQAGAELFAQATSALLLIWNSPIRGSCGPPGGVCAIIPRIAARPAHRSVCDGALLGSFIPSTPKVGCLARQRTVVFISDSVPVSASRHVGRAPPAEVPHWLPCDRWRAASPLLLRSAQALRGGGVAHQCERSRLKNAGLCKRQRVTALWLANIEADCGPLMVCPSSHFPFLKSLRSETAI
jgi:hypothetical protein